MTQRGERALRAELDRLRHQLDVEFAGRLRDARAFGEAAGNDEYLQIKVEEVVLAAGIARLEVLLAYEQVTAKAASAGSPVGRALMGRAAGDEVEAQLPDDRKRRLRIVAIRRPGRA